MLVSEHRCSCGQPLSGAFWWNTDQVCRDCWDKSYATFLAEEPEYLELSSGSASSWCALRAAAFAMILLGGIYLFSRWFL